MASSSSYSVLNIAIVVTVCHGKSRPCATLKKKDPPPDDNGILVKNQSEISR